MKCEDIAMAEGKQRSTLFKFFYVILSVITFPIFMVLYILKHPFWVLFFVGLILGGVAYYPISQGVELDRVPQWYQTKYAELKLNLATKAAESGQGGLVSQEMLKDLADELEESQGLKSENYNAKIARDEELLTKTSNIKKRGGFKRKDKSADTPDSLSEEAIAVEHENAVVGEVVKEGTPEDKENMAGGLEAILKGYVSNDEVVEGSAEIGGALDDNFVNVTTEETAKAEEEPDVLLPQGVEMTSEVVEAEKQEKKQNADTAVDDLDEFDLF